MALEEARDQGRAGVDGDERALRLRRLEEGLELRQSAGTLSSARRGSGRACSPSSFQPHNRRGQASEHPSRGLGHDRKTPPGRIEDEILPP